MDAEDREMLIEEWEALQDEGCYCHKIPVPPCSFCDQGGNMDLEEFLEYYGGE